MFLVHPLFIVEASWTVGHLGGAGSQPGKLIQARNAVGLAMFVLL